MSIEPNEDDCRVEEEGVGDAEDDIGYSIAVEVLGPEIETAGIEVDHPGGRI